MDLNDCKPQIDLMNAVWQKNKLMFERLLTVSVFSVSDKQKL